MGMVITMALVQSSPMNGGERGRREKERLKPSSFSGVLETSLETLLRDRFSKELQQAMVSPNPPYHCLSNLT